MEKIKIGIIGCGNISNAYIGVLKKQASVEIAAVADLDSSKSQAKAAEHNLKAVSVDELLGDKSITCVLNLTIPAAHAPVAIQALNAGKHVYNEKPLTASLEEGRAIMALAGKNKLRIGAAPDTFMGAGFQTCRKVIDSGMIGTPVAGVAFMLCPGHESWHPAPEFYYKVGGGPMLDMGPYYLTALVSLLGPIKRVTGSTRITHPTRTITSQPLNGTVVKVDVPTHVTGLLEFASGAIITIITSFDVYAHHMPNIEIYGSGGSLQVPDPNGFGGEVLYCKGRENKWNPIETTAFPYHGQGRGIGITDMANAIRSGRAHRANGEMALHVLEVMHSLHVASDTGKHVTLTSTCQRPLPMPEGLADDTMDA